MKQAVLAIEDRRFYEHPGVDPIGMVGALLSNLRGKRAYTAGASTITQQVVRNVFLPKMFPGMTLQEAREKSWRRKVLEVWVSLILTTRASKDEILEMYLNDMTLGQRGSFGIVGVPEASRLFFGKDVSNVTLAEAATIAGAGALDPVAGLRPHRLQIRPGAEHPALAVQDRDRSVGIDVEGTEGVGERRRGRPIDGVTALRTRQDDRGHRTVALHADVAHAAPTARPTNFRSASTISSASGPPSASGDNGPTSASPQPPTSAAAVKSGF